MKNTLFICLFAMFALSGCVDDEEEFATGGNISPELTPENKENAVLNTALFLTNSTSTIPAWKK